MIFDSAASSDAQLRAALAAGRAEYERQADLQSPEILTDLLGVESLWEAERRMLDRIAAHVRTYERIADRELLELVVLWKFPASVGAIRSTDPSRIADVTERAFGRPTAREAIETLTDLNGLSASTASAVLAFANPGRYAVMGPDTTTALRDLGFWEYPCEASTNRYEQYCLRCHELCQRTGLSLRDVDRGLYVVGGEGHSGGQ